MRTRRPSGSTVCLVACCKKKHSGRARPAEELYASKLFELSRAFARANSTKWFILSAKHELLAPRDRVKPYDLSLNQLNRDARKNWANRVYAKLERRLSPDDRIVILAGKRYREDLSAILGSAGFSIHAPLAGKKLGEQLQWLKKKTGQ